MRAHNVLTYFNTQSRENANYESLEETKSIIFIRCVCVRVRACVRACVGVCVLSLSLSIVVVLMLLLLSHQTQSRFAIRRDRA